MMPSKVPQIAHELSFARENDLLNDAYGCALDNVFRHGVATNEDRKELSRRVQKCQIRQALEGPFKMPRNTHGEIIQGLDAKERFIRVKLEWMLAPILTLAATGGGKSLAALFRAIQLCLFTQSLWLIDSGLKHEWRRIRSLLESIGIELLIVHGQATRFAPFAVPKGVPASAWINRISDLFIHVLSLPRRASQLLQSTLHKLYLRMNIYEGERIGPSLFDVLQAVREDRTANPQARSALADGLESLVAGTRPEVFACRVGWPVDKLAELPINWVFNDVAPKVRDLFVAYLVLAQLMIAIAEGQSNVTRPRMLVSIDEAGPLLRGSSSSPNPLSDLLSQTRGLGIILDLAVSSSAAIAPEVLSTAGTRYLGRINSASDAESLGRSMGLKRHQYDYIFQRLKTGEFVCQCGAADNDLRIPHLVKIPRMSFPSDLGSTEDHLGVLSSWNTETTNECSTVTPGVHADDANDTSIFDDERVVRFCECVEANPLKPSSWYPKQVRISTATAHSIRKQLIKQGLLTEHEVQQHARGRASILLELTSLGASALNEYRDSGEQDHER